jgi:phenylalanyl-tRNA synthetase alpha chain
METVSLKQTLHDDLKSVASGDDIERIRVKYLGRKSEIAHKLRELGNLNADEKRVLGPELQALKREIAEAIEKKRREWEDSARDWEGERVDATLPGKKVVRGHIHPITKTLREVEDIFVSMGFDIAEGPEIETEFYNFDALNIPKDHPARDMQDAFFVEEKNEKGERLLPRTHTSNAQVRYMQTHTPPFRVIMPGKIFRREATDASHEHTFHQFEALVVGDAINVANFKSIAAMFFSAFFGKDISIRLRSSFFPFTEPSFEFDISCMVCGGKGCSVCKKTGWIEVGGAGMVHQNVFVASGYERGRYQGFAWGFGVERLAMMKYGIDDIRLFHSGDLRFIRQF